MFKITARRSTLILTCMVGGLSLAACASNGSSRYGGEECCEPVECTTNCGYYVLPITKIVTVEKELPPPPPVIIHEPAKPIPCPSDTTPDANGACIRTVTVQLPPPPPVVIPCQNECYPPTIPPYLPPRK